MNANTDPGESEFAPARSGGRNGRRPGNRPTATVTPPIAPGMEYQGTIAADTVAEAVESQAALLHRRPALAPKPKPVRRARPQ